MDSNYLIVLFKNKKKRKIIKRYTKEKSAINFFKDLIEQQNKIIFPKIIENAEETSYTLGLLTNTTNVQKSLFLKDDLGRNIPANIENSKASPENIQPISKIANNQSNNSNQSAKNAIQNIIVGLFKDLN